MTPPGRNDKIRISKLETILEYTMINGNRSWHRRLADDLSSIGRLPMSLSLFSLVTLVTTLTVSSAYAIGGVDSPPAPAAPAQPQFAPPAETKLDNGLRVIVAHRPG